ncbi:hypothetical protein L486_01912 [Kwoniella mangroviensis CBS 10435]|uniref:Uncharacterized protein n=1 Tax=Kwoniella mangroviensis CBS 10435 TaxID=1331196 RepID=A0A1B9J3K7_9TREE|nr:hypothetical protein L486_01912 [Kwoniella mangroviensis CBS 10435]
MATDDQDIDTSTSGKSFEITIYRQAEGDPSNWVPVKIPFTPWDDPDEWTFPSPEMPRCWPEFFKEDRVLQEKYAALYKSHHAWQKACFTEEDETKVIQMEGVSLPLTVVIIIPT